MPPQAMTDLKQWVNYAIEDRVNPNTGEITSTKVPYQAGTWRLARSNDPTTWAPWERAQGRPLGFMFTYHTGIMGIDLDHCIGEDGTLSHIAQDVLRVCRTYTEVSPSGTGLHLFGYGTLPEHRGRRNDTEGLEMYDSKRYFTVTEHSYHDPALPIANIQPGVDYLLKRYLTPPAPPAVAYPAHDTTWTDTQVIGFVRRNPKYNELWQGGIGSFPSHSHADASLLGYLSKVCHGDRAQVQRLYAQSPRAGRVKDGRVKWERPDYQRRTLDLVAR